MQFDQATPTQDAVGLRSALEVEGELDRIAVEFRNPIPDDRRTQLYAAQQALAWVRGIGAPAYDTIINGKVQPLITDTPEGSEGCSAARHPTPS